MASVAQSRHSQDREDGKLAGRQPHVCRLPSCCDPGPLYCAESASSSHASSVDLTLSMWMDAEENLVPFSDTKCKPVG